jgi:hypothetical protein
MCIGPPGRIVEITADARRERYDQIAGLANSLGGPG